MADGVLEFFTTTTTSTTKLTTNNYFLTTNQYVRSYRNLWWGQCSLRAI